MSTTLKEQLQRLAVPQTATLADTRKKVSILFDQKEAATKDRRTIFQLGISGLQELTALNSYFQQFEATLFDETTLHLERAVETSEVNELLDANIRKFLQHLSPYFLLRPAHMCIEWLLRRFLVHEYNRSDLMALALPYHETNVFVLVLQTLRLRPDDREWAWLRPLRTPGVPLPKSAILNRAASDRAFLSFVCRSTLQAVRELGPARAHLLQAQINFYASVVVGALEHTGSVEEWHIVGVLPSLLYGLGSETVDFVSAAYIVAAQFVARTRLTHKLCVALIERVAGVTFERLRRTAVLLLIWIFDTQTASEPSFSERTLLTFVQHKWLTPTLAALAKENVAIQSLCAPLLRGAVAVIQSGNAENSDIFKLFLERLIGDVEFSPSTAQQVISCFLDAYIAPVSASKKTCSTPAARDGDVIEIDSDDDEMAAVGADFQSWYSEYLRKLERQYPNAFDFTIKEALKSKQEESTNRSKALKMALAFRLKSCNQNATDIYESLYHHSAKIRLHAVKTLLANLSDYQQRPQNYQLLKESLADRICDDNEQVVATVLKLQTKDFTDILGYEKFVQALFGILYKTQVEAEQWTAVTLPVVRHLTSEQVVANFDTNLILLALMPLLFPAESTQSARESIAEILGSSLINKVRVLRELKLNTTSKKKATEFSSSDFKKHFLDVISRSKDTPAVLDMFESVAAQGSDFFQQPMQLAHFILLVTAFLKKDFSGADSLKMLEAVCNYCKPFPIKQAENQQWQQVRNQQFVPLQLFSDFLTALALHTRFDEQLLDWSQDTKELQCFLNIFSLLAEKAFTLDNGTSEKLEWTKTLKAIFDIVFKSAQAKVDFLANFYLYESFELIENFTALRLRSFKLLNAILKNSENKFTLDTEHLLKISIALNSPTEVVRIQALETLRVVVEQSRSDRKVFIERILERGQEIAMDNEQFPLVLYTILKPAKADKQKSGHLAGAKILQEILKLLSINDKNALLLRNVVFITETLQILKHLNDDEILLALLPLATSALERTRDDGTVKLLEPPYSQIYQRIIERFDSQTIENVLVDQPQAWQLFERIFGMHDVFVVADGKLQPVPCVALDAFDELTFERMPAQYKYDLIKLIVRTLAVAENDTIFLSANKLLKKCTFDCQPLVVILERMFRTPNKAKTPQRKSLSSTKRETTISKVDIATLEWKEGVALLELLEHKKKLNGTEKIIAVLFELLQVCLEVEEQISVEYTKQLTLSALIHCCQKSKTDGVDLQATLPKSTFRINQIVQCVRASQNPQTHQNALMLLSHCAALFPHQVLHNIVDIFTFMGSSVVRHDDAFSFYTINNIIESIVPILVTEKNSSSVAKSKRTSEIGLNSTMLIIPVLKVFSDIMLDVPEHRRLPLYTKLLQTLGAEQYLWTLLCVVFEAHVIDDEKQRLLLKKSNNASGATIAAVSDKVSKRIEIALELTNSFSPQILLETCIQLMTYVKNLPLDKETNAQISANSGKRLSSSVEISEVSLFDVKVRSPQQLRHYKYVIMQFLSSVSNSAEFLRKIALLSDDELLAIKPYYQNFIIQTLSFVPIVNTAIEKSEELSKTKYWRVILHHLHDVLDNAISLLSPDMFLAVVNGLMQHQLLSIRKKVIELLINKLQQRNSYFDSCDEKNFHNMLKPLSEIVGSILQKDDTTPTTASSNELVFLQQTALIAIKLLSKLFALKYITEFKALLAELTTITKNRKNISKIVLATVVLTMIEISSNLKAHSLAQLPKYMPQLIELLQDHAELVRRQAPDNVCIAIITGMQKLFESLPLFLGPYMVDIITALSSISTHIALQQNEKDQRSASALNKISIIWNKIATEVPARILVPSSEKAYKKLLSTESYADIGVLMKLLLGAIGKTSNADLVTVQSELSNFFLHALEFRLHLQQQRVGNNFPSERVAATEESIINAFVAWVLKLSEGSFRPLYHKLYEWALKGKQQKETTLTYFLLTDKIAEALKSLFVLFASDFIDDTAKLLNENNSSVESNLLSESDETDIDVELLKAILNTLHKVFLYDSKGFINTHRFEILLQPIVDQLENRLVLENDALQQNLSSCIAQLAVTVSSDILWKQLNYQVLLKTRTNVPEVRMLSFNCCVEIARKLGEDFTPLLPETVPFIAELFEDENPRVEKNTRKSVQELEGILGESLQKYL